MQHFQDERGILSVIDDRELPFKIKRVFWIQNVPSGMIRGHHAHRDCEQVIICITGSFDIYLDYRKRTLESRDSVYIQAGHPVVLGGFSSDAVCLVLCSEYYNASDVH